MKNRFGLIALASTILAAFSVAQAQNVDRARAFECPKSLSVTVKKLEPKGEFSYSFSQTQTPSPIGHTAIAATLHYIRVLFSSSEQMRLESHSLGLTGDEAYGSLIKRKLGLAKGMTLILEKNIVCRYQPLDLGGEFLVNRSEGSFDGGVNKTAEKLSVGADLFFTYNSKISAYEVNSELYFLGAYASNQPNSRARVQVGPRLPWSAFYNDSNGELFQVTPSKNIIRAKDRYELPAKRSEIEEVNFVTKLKINTKARSHIGATESERQFEMDAITYSLSLN
ncbi:MAG: hypothetical protein COT74_03170 [Bdellovibrionales bacterium CG10_big_fil_rev_8_21_14_0_10_45_34]|nr:MAG: hypothetical protein COT74_03170 [Bdellovibrionales bacterium CG10_big_fil_rev_8_21_14_0_10_45_34]